MELLGTSPDVLFERVYAYERAYLTYLLQWARLPLEGAASSDRWHRASIDQVGHVPAGKLLGGIPWTERRLLAGRRATVVGTSPPGRLAYRLGSDENYGRHRPPPRYYVGDGPDLGSEDGAARPADPGWDTWCATPRPDGVDRRLCRPPPSQLRLSERRHAGELRPALRGTATPTVTRGRQPRTGHDRRPIRGPCPRHRHRCRPARCLAGHRP